MQVYPLIYSHRRPYMETASHYDRYWSARYSVLTGSHNLLFSTSCHKKPCVIQNMPAKKSTRTHLHVTNIHESDDTLQAVPSTAKRATPSVWPEAEIDNHNENVL